MNILSKTKQKSKENFKLSPTSVDKFNSNLFKKAFSEKYLTPAMMRILAVLYHEKIKNKRSYLFQAKLAYEADVTRTHTNKCLQDLQELNFIKIHNRGYNSCLYFLHPLFFKTHIRTFLSKLEQFSYLNMLMIFMLFSFSNMSHGSINGTSCFSNRSRSFLESIYTRENSERGQRASQFFNINSKREMIKTMVTPINKHICANTRLTEYCSLQLSAYDDTVLNSAYHYYLKKRKEVKNPALFLLKMCRVVCKAKNIEANYRDMLLKVNAAGYKPGDALLFSDPESQPRFDSKPSAHTPHKKELSQKASQWLSTFNSTSIMQRINEDEKNGTDKNDNIPLF